MKFLHLFIGFIFLIGVAVPVSRAASVRTKNRYNNRRLFNQPGEKIQITQSDPYVGNQMRLLQDILSQYDPRIRPVRRPLQPVNITVRMNLYQLVEVEERTQHVAIYAWMTQMWHDEVIAWDPSKYGNISSVVLPYTQVWIPDTYLYNNLQMEREASERWSHVIVEMFPNDERAHVTFRYPAMYKFICNMNIKYFPFDRQDCTLKFGSWIFDASAVDYFPERSSVAREDFIETKREEWKLISFTTKRRVNRYACCPYPFTILEFTLIVKRRPMHYLVNLLIPTFIVSVVSNVGFFTPTTTGGERIEKVNLGLTTLLAYSVLLMMVSDSMPSTSSTVPLIGWFLLGTIVQTSVATIATSIILIVHKKGNEGKPVPNLLRQVFFCWINRFLRVKPPNQAAFDWEDKSDLGFPILTRYAPRRASNVFSRIYFGKNAPSSRRQSRVSCRPMDETPQLDGFRIVPVIKVSRPSGSRKGSEESVPSLANGNSLPLLSMPINEEDEEMEEANNNAFEIEWEWLACILDRLCLILSLLSLITFILGIIFLGYFVGQNTPSS